MSAKLRNKEPLVGAILLLLLGIVTLIRGTAGLPGVAHIFGAHAKAYGVFCIAFSAVLFYVHFRSGKQN
jgi:hypothetical protein